LIAEGIEGLAICFLNSYANAQHEAVAKVTAQQLSSGLYVSASHELTGEFREYERFLTTVLNAYIGPVLQNYFRHFQMRLKDLGLTAEPQIIQSNGGFLSVDSALASPVRTVLSGPSAGVAGAAHVARSAGIPNVITLDMGGTSTDVSLMRDAQPSYRSGLTVGGYRIRVPAIAIHTIGAGGGSIAWMDETRGFHVGPRSAGAVPGPAAYGLGGTEPTVTDANIVLGRLNPRVLLGGAVCIQRDLAERAIDDLATKLGLSAERTAAGILDIAVSNMVRAVRVISVEQGEDPREFALIAFGGAGPLHASAIARQLGMHRLLIPSAPGLLCAVGALLSEPKTEFARTHVMTLGSDPNPINKDLLELEAQAIAWMDREGLEPGIRMLTYSVDMRYLRQNYELSLTLPSILEDPEDLDDLANRFHDLHQRHYGYASPGHPIQLVTLRVVASGRMVQTPMPRLSAPVRPPAERDMRSVYFETIGHWSTCPVYWRNDLGAGTSLNGPAVIEQVDSTILLYPGDRGCVDKFGHMTVEVSDEF
jgi:N-methylhydantoinase A